MKTKPLPTNCYREDNWHLQKWAYAHWIFIMPEKCCFLCQNCWISVGKWLFNGNLRYNTWKRYINLQWNTPAILRHSNGGIWEHRRSHLTLMEWKRSTDWHHLYFCHNIFFFFNTTIIQFICKNHKAIA